MALVLNWAAGQNTDWDKPLMVTVKQDQREGGRGKEGGRRGREGDNGGGLLTVQTEPGWR